VIDGRPIRRLATLVASLSLLCCSTALAAEPTETISAHVMTGEHGADRGAHSSEKHFMVGAMGSYLAAIHGDEVHHYGGGGLLFEATLVPHWLEMEYSVRALSDGHALLFPVDVLLKLPFHVSDTVIPYIGAGPTLVPAFVDELSAHAGIATSAGAGFWLWSWGGLIAELNYNLLFEGDLVHEIGGSGGVGYRF